MKTVNIHEAKTHLSRLIEVREILRSAVPGEEIYGFTPDAGLPLGFRPATQTGGGA